MSAHVTQSSLAQDIGADVQCRRWSVPEARAEYRSSLIFHKLCLRWTHTRERHLLHNQSSIAMKREYLLKSQDSLACTADVTTLPSPSALDWSRGALKACNRRRLASTGPLQDALRCTGVPGCATPQHIDRAQCRHARAATTSMDWSIGCRHLRESIHHQQAFSPRAHSFLHQPLDGSQANALGLWEIEMDIDWFHNLYPCIVHNLSTTVRCQPASC